MIEILSKLLPIFLIFFAVLGVKRLGFLNSDDGSTLLKVGFYTALPALAFQSILKVEVDASLIWLCILPGTVVGLTIALLLLLKRSLLRHVRNKTFGALLAGSAIMNTGFVLPFVQQLYGAEGLARLMIIDVFNGIVTFTIVYGMVVKLAHDQVSKKFILNKLLISPPVWALVIALILKLADLTPPAAILNTTALLAQLAAPLILIALALKFSLKIRQPRLLLVPLLARFGLGAAVGLLFVWLFQLEGVTADVVLFASMAPIGFNSITFSELEKLDVDFAVSQVSVAIVLALILMPLLAYFVG